MNNNNSINNPLNNIQTILFELNDTNPNIRTNDMSSSNSNIKK